MRRTPAPARPARPAALDLLAAGDQARARRPPPPPPPGDALTTVDASLYEVEPDILPVDPAAVAAARAAAAAGEGSGVTFFTDDTPPLPEGRVVAAVSTPVGRGGDASPSSPPTDPDAHLRGLSPAEVDARTGALVALATAGEGFEGVLARVGPGLDAATLRLLERRIEALRM
jgi:hypothetical protein